MKYLIIGAGAAGLSAAKIIKRIDPDSKVTVVSDEFQPFYIKPSLIDYLAKDITLKTLTSAKDQFVSQNKSIFITGKRVKEIIPDKNLAVFTDNESIDYSFLLLATGAAFAMPEILKGVSSKLHMINNFADAVRLTESCTGAKKAVVFGKGYPSLEVVRGLAKRGLSVDFVIPESNYGTDSSSDLNKEKIDKLFNDKGVKVYFNETIADILDMDGKTCNVVTSAGRSLHAQIVVSASCYSPNIDFVKGSGIKTDKGILVTEELRTNIANIYAAGDVAQFYDINRKENRFNFGWISAFKQGEIAGENMAGRNDIFISTDKDYFSSLYGEKFLKRW